MSVVPGMVRLTRPRHPFEGQQLPVLGSMRRHAALELLVVLPDGSKRLVPASWTDLEPAAGTDRSEGPQTLGTAADLLGLSALVSALRARSRQDQEQAARNPPAREDNRAACPAQSAAGAGSGATTGPDRPVSRPASRKGHHAAGGPDRPGAGRRGSGDGR